MQPEHQYCVVDAHAALRAGTRDAHHALHASRTLDALARGELSRAEYARLMQSFHAFYAVLDTRLGVACDALLGAHASYRYHARAPLLAADVDALGRTHDTTPGPSLPGFGDIASLVGALYVVEGSMLGAATLERGARRVLGAHAGCVDDGDERGRRYWAWARREAAARWAGTLDLLGERLRTPLACARAEESARATFTTLHAWLAPLDDAPC